MTDRADDPPPLTITSEAARRLSGEDGRRFESKGIPIVMDDYAVEILAGAVLEIDPDPAGDGYRLDHPNAILTTFC